MTEDAIQAVPSKGGGSARAAGAITNATTSASRVITQTDLVGLAGELIRSTMTTSLDTRAPYMRTTSREIPSEALLLRECLTPEGARPSGSNYLTSTISACPPDTANATSDVALPRAHTSPLPTTRMSLATTAPSPFATSPEKEHESFTLA